MQRRLTLKAGFFEKWKFHLGQPNKSLPLLLTLPPQKSIGLPSRKKRMLELEESGVLAYKQQSDDVDMGDFIDESQGKEWETNPKSLFR